MSLSVSGADEHAANGPARTRRWADALVRRWRFLGVLRDRHRARRASIESLALYRELEAAYPDLGGIARYEQVVAHRTGADAQRVRAIIQHATDSFAAWPVHRPLSFRDVVQYLVIAECLGADPSAIGTDARLTAVVADVIPAHL